MYCLPYHRFPSLLLCCSVAPYHLHLPLADFLRAAGKDRHWDLPVPWSWQKSFSQYWSLPQERTPVLHVSSTVGGAATFQRHPDWGGREGKRRAFPHSSSFWAPAICQAGSSGHGTKQLWWPFWPLGLCTCCLFCLECSFLSCTQGWQLLIICQSYLPWATYRDSAHPSPMTAWFLSASFKIAILRPGAVAHACNPSMLGG